MRSASLSPHPHALIVSFRNGSLSIGFAVVNGKNQGSLSGPLLLIRQMRPIAHYLVFLLSMGRPWGDNSDSRVLRCAEANQPHSKATGGNDHGADFYQSGDGGLVR